METQVDAQAFAYAELLEILSYMEKKDVDKIPRKLMDVFRHYASTSYLPHLDSNIPFEEQNLSEETYGLLGMLIINYWCESEEEKQYFIDAFTENEKQYQNELREKYNPDKIFENPSTAVSTDTETISEETTASPSPSNLPVDYRTFTWYQKLFTKMRNFIYRLLKKEN